MAQDVLQSLYIVISCCRLASFPDLVQVLFQLAAQLHAKSGTQSLHESVNQLQLSLMLAAHTCSCNKLALHINHAGPGGKTDR